MSNVDVDGLNWATSSFCETGACLAFASQTDTAFVRDTKHDDGPILTFDRHAWASFLAGVREGDFDLPA